MKLYVKEKAPEIWPEQFLKVAVYTKNLEFFIVIGDFVKEILFSTFISVKFTYFSI